MIHAHEVQLGNLVYHRNWRKLAPMLEPIIGTITQIGKNGFTIDGKWQGSQAEGIPITPSLLETCGFERIPEFSNTHWEYKMTTKNSTKLFYHCGTSSFIIGEPCASRTTIIYIHQLQNILFALTGEQIIANP